MSQTQILALSAALLFFTLGAAAVVLLPYLLRWQPKPKEKKQRGGTFEDTCRACQRVLVLHRNTITMLTAAEKGMAVSARPSLRGKPLGRYTCPYCDAAHYYAVENGRFVFAGVNFYEPQERTTRCMMCEKPLRTPPWPETTYDGRIDEIPVKSPDYGLICSRCHSVSCIACCETVTKGSARAEGYLCPRCGRRPVERFFYAPGAT